MEGKGPFTHILVPIDGSDTAMEAGKLAIQIAAMHKVQITFLCVVDRIVAENIAGATARSVEETCQELEQKGHHYLDYLSRLARTRGLQASQVILRGIPHREIADLARERSVDLIVIGKVGRHGAQRIHIGSVAERVIASAPCPVMVVRHTPPSS
jgi:nucleotide-binding universal stress UspA family protein